jgi:hypothetical protein
MLRLKQMTDLLFVYFSHNEQNYNLEREVKFTVVKTVTVEIIFFRDVAHSAFVDGYISTKLCDEKSQKIVICAEMV